MKKFIASLAVGAMMLVGAGQAAAYFEENHLIRVVYDKRGGGKEVVTDLLDISTWKSLGVSPSNLVVGSGAQAWNLSMFPGASLNNLRVEYYAVHGPNADAWTSGPLTEQRAGNRQFTGFLSDGTNGRTFFQNVYIPIGDGSTVIGNETALNSHYSLMAKNGLTLGGFGNFIPLKNGGVQLDQLSPTGYIDQALYFYDNPNGANPYGVQVAVIRTMADGSTIINPSAVPIPASVLLLGSGLLGLIGIRRKNS